METPLPVPVPTISCPLPSPARLRPRPRRPRHPSKEDEALRHRLGQRPLAERLLFQGREGHPPFHTNLVQGGVPTPVGHNSAEG